MNVRLKHEDLRLEMASALVLSPSKRILECLEGLS